MYWYQSEILIIMLRGCCDPYILDMDVIVNLILAILKDRATEIWFNEVTIQVVRFTEL